MRILLALVLLILLSGGAWILIYESRLVAVAPCKGNLEGTFLAAKECQP